MMAKSDGGVEPPPNGDYTVVAVISNDNGQAKFLKAL